MPPVAAELAALEPILAECDRNPGADYRVAELATSVAVPRLAFVVVLLVTALKPGCLCPVPVARGPAFLRLLCVQSQLRLAAATGRSRFANSAPVVRLVP